MPEACHAKRALFVAGCLRGVWLCLLLISLVSARAQLGLEISLVTSGGAAADGGTFTLTSAIGQPEAGEELAGGIFTLKTGFLPASLNPSTNAAPVVELADSLLAIVHESEPQTFVNFATFSPGPASKASQALLGYFVQTDNPGAFSSGPAIDLDGTLRLTPASRARGRITVLVIAQDSGGGANGGVDKSTNHFIVELTPINAAPSASFTDEELIILEDQPPVTIPGFASLVPGAPDEIGQLVAAYTVTVENDGLFLEGPALNNDGTLTFKTAANLSGTSPIVVVVQDNGGTENGGVDLGTNSFLITVQPVNDPPSVAFSVNPIPILEDSGSQVFEEFAVFNPGPNEGTQSLSSYTVSTDFPGLFAVAPSISATGTLTFTPSANTSGRAEVTVVVQDNGGTENDGVDLSTNSFVITINAVNDAPAVTFASSEITLFEDAGSQTIENFASFHAGSNEGAQGLVAYTVTTDNSGLFNTAPAISSTGTLSFTPSANVSGQAAVTVVVQDDGGTENDGVDLSTNSFVITINAVNDAPAVTFASSEITLLEDAGSQTIENFASFNAGSNEGAQALAAYTVTTDNSGLFNTTPAISSTGTLSFTPSANANGQAAVTVVVQDDGGTDNDGVDLSTNSFLITINAVNDAPAVTFASSEITLLEDAGSQTIENFASFNAGSNEGAQALVAYTVTTDNSGLFSTAPAISSTGKLSFTPSANTSGQAAVTVVVQDDGGTDNDGVDLSTNSFVITINAVNDAPAVTFASSEITLLEDAGSQTIENFASFNAGSNESAQALVAYTVATDNSGLFSTAPAISATGTLSFAPSANTSGQAAVTVVVQDDGGTEAGGLDLSTNSFLIVVRAVNDAPSVALTMQELDLVEDADAQSVSGFALFSPGPHESEQALQAYALLVDNAALFSSAPSLSENGTLTFTPAPDQYGETTVTVVVQDNGGIIHDGVDRSTNSFLIRIAPVNDSPVVTFAQQEITLSEDAGAILLESFAFFHAGPNESDQQLINFEVSTSNPTLFVQNPVLSNDGQLTFTPTSHASGQAEVKVVVRDNGGIVNGGHDLGTNTFLITINAVNDAPAVTFATDQVVILEDAGNQVFASFARFHPGPNEEDQSLVAYVLSVPDPTLFLQAPAFSQSGDLTFTPAANRSGLAEVTVIVQDSGDSSGGGEARSTNHFLINITPVNDAPAVTFAASEIRLLEDDAPQTLPSFARFEPGPHESEQALTRYDLAHSHPELFSVAPALNNAGDLTFTLASHQNGQSEIFVIVEDDGGLLAGGFNRSTNRFTIHVSDVNDAPLVSFTSSELSVLEDAGPQTIEAFAHFGPGPNEPAQSLVSYLVTTENTSLFASQPALSPAGALQFRTEPHVSGSAIIQVVVTDNGGTANGGQDSSTNTFSILVVGVNDQPSVLLAFPDITIFEDDGPQTIPNFASFNAGPREPNQLILGYEILTADSTLFSALPQISVAGTLSFTAAIDQYGESEVVVVVQDDGGTAHGGMDRSTNRFLITVSPVNDQPSVKLAARQVTVLEDAAEQIFAGFAEFDPGPNEPSQAVADYQVTTTNPDIFALAPLMEQNGTLRFKPASNRNGIAEVQVVVTDSAGAKSATNSFLITIAKVNDAPTVDLALTEVVIPEDAGPQEIVDFARFSPGPWEPEQALLHYTLSTDFPELFEAPPLLDASGTLRFRVASDLSGSAKVTLVVSDDGGGEHGGIDRNTYQFTIRSTPVNDPPQISFREPGIRSQEDAGPTEQKRYISIGPGQAEGNQSVEIVSITPANPALFVTQPWVNSLRDLLFTSAPDAHGTTTVTVIVADNGGTDQGGIDRATNSFTIEITSLNDPPLVSLSTRVVTAPNFQETLLENFASFNPGPPDEAAQTLVGYELETDHAALFSHLPELDLEGSLRFTPKPGGAGRSKVTITATDSGGSEQSDDNPASSIDFEIVIPAINIDLPADDGLLNSAELEQDLLITGHAQELADDEIVLLTLHNRNYSERIADGKWSLVIPAADLAQLTDGENYLLSAKVRRADGAVVAAATRSLKIDRSIGTLLVATVAGDDIFNAAESKVNQLITGSLDSSEQGTVVTVSLNGKFYPATIVGPVWQATIPAAHLSALLDNHPHTLTAELRDLAGNTHRATRAVQTDRSAPRATAVHGPAPGYYREGAIFTFSILLSEQLLFTPATRLPSMTLTVGRSFRFASWTGLDDETLRFQYLVQAGDDSAGNLRHHGHLSLGDSALTDAAGNPLSLTLPEMTSDGIIVDNQPPLVTLAGPVMNYQNGSASWSLHIADNYLDVASIDLSNLSLETSDTVGAVLDLSGSGTTWTITISEFEGQGTVQLQFAGLQAFDLARNPATLPIAAPIVVHSGRLLSGPIAGATVFLDDDGDRELDSSEPQARTDESGSFVLIYSAADFPGDLSSKSILAKGGLDITTGVALPSVLEAPFGSTVLSPISTLLNRQRTASEIAAKLGLPAVDFLHYNPFLTPNEDLSLQIIAANAKLQDTVVQLAALVSTVAERELPAVAAQIYDLLPGRLAPGFFSDAAALRQLLDDAAAAAGTAFSDRHASWVAELIALNNTAKDLLLSQSGPDRPLQIAALSTTAQLLMPVFHLAAADPSLGRASFQALADQAESLNTLPLAHGVLRGDDLRPGAFNFARAEFVPSLARRGAFEAIIVRSGGTFGRQSIDLRLSPNIAPITVEFGHRQTLRTIDLSAIISSSSEFQNLSELLVTLEPRAVSVIGERSQANLVLVAVPRITRDPASQPLAVGSPLVLDADFKGAEPISFQWSRNGLPITGATSPSLEIAPTRLVDSGAYTLTISNRFGSATSRPAVVVVSDGSLQFAGLAPQEDGTIALQVYSPDKPFLLESTRDFITWEILMIIDPSSEMQEIPIAPDGLGLRFFRARSEF